MEQYARMFHSELLIDHAFVLFHILLRKFASAQTKPQLLMQILFCSFFRNIGHPMLLITCYCSRVRALRILTMRILSALFQVVN